MIICTFNFYFIDSFAKNIKCKRNWKLKNSNFQTLWPPRYFRNCFGRGVLFTATPTQLFFSLPNFTHNFTCFQLLNSDGVNRFVNNLFYFHLLHLPIHSQICLCTLCKVLDTDIWLRKCGPWTVKFRYIMSLNHWFIFICAFCHQFASKFWLAVCKVWQVPPQLPRAAKNFLCIHNHRISETKMAHSHKKDNQKK